MLQVLPNDGVAVTPERGLVAGEGSAELELKLLLTRPGQMAATLELDVRGGKTLKLPIRCAA